MNQRSGNIFDRKTGKQVAWIEGDGVFSATTKKKCATLRGVEIYDLLGKLVCGVLSLRHFRLASWCSLSLGGWWPRIRRGAVWLGRRDAARPARADGEAAGGAVDFHLVIFRFGATMELGRSERPTLRPLWSYRVAGADSPDRKLCWRACSLRHFRLASWCSLSLCGWWPRIRRGAVWLGRRDAARPARADGEAAGGAVDFHLVIFRFGATIGARAIGATDAAAAVELPGRRRRQPGSKAAQTGSRRALSPTFPAGELVFFIPWRVVAENPARRSLAWAARCCSTRSGRW